MESVVVVGRGVAGSEVGTYLGENTKVPLEIIEIEREPSRSFGGWAFQSFPITECTNLAFRKMYLGKDENNIHEWLKNCDRSNWPSEVKDFDFNPDQPFPRVLMREYVKWRRSQVKNPLVKYTSVIGEANKVYLDKDWVSVEVEYRSRIQANRLVMAAGSITVKVPEYLNKVLDNEKLIVDPLVLAGHQRRATIPENSRVLILGTGLTGEEQVNVLLKSNHTSLTLFSREGQRHFAYPEFQKNEKIELKEPPQFLFSETPEEFSFQMSAFFENYLKKGHSPEDVYAAMQPFADRIRAGMGGCLQAAERLKDFKRTLATNAIGLSWEVSENFKKAQEEGKVRLLRGKIIDVEHNGSNFVVQFEDEIMFFDWIINAVGRNIIRHPIWDGLLEDGIAIKHAGIGVQVSENGRLYNKDKEESDRIWVVGMARAGDHMLRHGYLGNSAFNVPQVRHHLYKTMDNLLSVVEG